MTNNGNPVQDLNPEQLLSFAAELMGEHLKKSSANGYLIYYHNELKIVTAGNVPTTVQVIKVFTYDQLTNGLTSLSWNLIREKLAELQHEVLSCKLESKLLPTRKQKSSSSS